MSSVDVNRDGRLVASGSHDKVRFFGFYFNGVKTWLRVVSFVSSPMCFVKDTTLYFIKWADVLLRSHKVVVLMLSDDSGVFYGARPHGSRTARTHPVDPERQIRP